MPDSAEAWLARGNTLRALQRHNDALAAYNQALEKNPNLAEVWVGRGSAMRALKRSNESLAAYDTALALQPDLAEAWLCRGNLLNELKRHEEGCAAYEKALEVKPQCVEAWAGLGNGYAELARWDEAIVAFGKALELIPELASAWLGCGNVFTLLALYDQAIVAYDQALASEPGLAAAWVGRGNASYMSKHYDDAVGACARAATLEPDRGYVQGALLDAKLQVCAWDDFDAHCSAIVDAVRHGKHVADPFAFLNLSSAPADQLQCAALYCADRFPPSRQPIRQGGRASHRRIRLAYISADLRDHAVSHLLAGVFERHDHVRFETIAVSLHSAPPSAMHTRLRNAFEHFVDAGRRSDRDVRQLLLELEVDIAVDLTGLTAGGRAGILAHRVVPVQVNYLGYPGTTGAHFIDYIIADRYVIPEDQQQHYSEKVAYLPDTFQANDSTREVIPRIASRAECGLPETGFVFCSFNNNHKITPPVFNTWMNLLRDVEDSVLWLYATNVAAERNLRCQAMTHGVAADRLIFAPGIAYPDHLARVRRGGLFLDTFPFNAGTTASDALWSGLPLVTCSGKAFASRMAGSLLNAVGLPELATGTLEEYATLASMLAHDPARLAQVKAKLERNRSSSALFDTIRFTRHIEAAYAEMWERHLRGEPPASFSVEPID